MGYRQPFTAMLAIWALLLAIQAFAQGVPAPAPGASPASQDAVLLRSKTLFDYRVKSPQGEDLGKGVQLGCRGRDHLPLARKRTIGA